MEEQALVTMDDGRAWSEEFAALLERWAPRFGRVEPRRRAAADLKGLLAPVEDSRRDKGWQLAEAAGERTPDGVQEFLGRVRWDADAVRDDRRSLCRRASGRSWRRAGFGRDRLGQEGEQVRRRAAAVFRHGGADRELPDRRVVGLCQPPRPGAARPCPRPARKLGLGAACAEPRPASLRRSGSRP